MWIGTHAEYTKLCNEGKQCDIDVYWKKSEGIENENLKYTVIKDVEQYKKYCAILEELILSENEARKDEIELITLLIENWDNKHNTFNDSDPIQLLEGLMEEHELKA